MMIALNFEGQFKIDDAKMQRIYNQKKLDKLIRQTIIALSHNAINLAKKKVLEANKLAFESCQLAILNYKKLAHIENYVPNILFYAMETICG